MNDIYSFSAGKNDLGVFIVDDVGDGTIDRTINLLAGIAHGAEKAIGSAVKRAATSGIAYASKRVREEYLISSSDFKKYTKTKRRIVTDRNGTTVDIELRGYHIPLYKFDTKVDKNGVVSARVKRSSSRAILDHVFKQEVGKYSHIGIFERVSDERMPITEKFGPSVPQMMAYNDDLEQDIGDHIREKFDERIEHEITAVLNGWRR